MLQDWWRHVDSIECMERTVGGVVTWAKSPEGQKWIRYSLVSVVAVACSQVILGFTFYVLEWSARAANITAVALSALPSYWLNRAWVWKKTDRSSVLREVIPFWGMAFLGLVFSTWAADYAATHAADFSDSRGVQTLIVMFASLAAFGVLWIGKFVILNRLLFAADDEMADEVAVETS